jgi:tRNA-dihydrouridine synthase B
LLISPDCNDGSFDYCAGRNLILINSGAIVIASACELSIGNLKLSNRALLAPMAGITDGTFRALAARFGAGLVVSEMIASAALSTGQKDMVRRLNRSGHLPHVVQLAGCDANWMAVGAKMAADAGADIIDINFGCPSKRVTNGFAGSALMQVPDQALRLIEAVIATTDLPVTVKMRLGWNEDKLNAADIARSAVNAGVQMISVHGRTRQQFYKGSARWELVRPVVEAVDVPVVVNGDIVDVASAKKALAQSGAAAVMIGRGAQGQPWLVGQVGAALDGQTVPMAPRGGALRDLIHEHYHAMLGEYGVDIGSRVARKHLGWYLDANVGNVDEEKRRALMCEKHPQAALEKLDAIMAETLPQNGLVAA